MVGMSDGEWLEYLINVPESGYYRIDLMMATDETFNSAKVRISAGNKVVDHILHSNGWFEYELNSLTIPLSAGNNTVRIQAEKSMNFDYFILSFMPELDEELEKAICSSMEQSYSCYKKYGNYLGININYDTEKVFNKGNIFELINGKYSDIVSIQNAFANAYAEKIISPDTIAQDSSGERIFAPVSDGFTVREMLYDVPDGIYVIGAIYKNDGSLVKCSFSETENGSAYLSFSDNHYDSPLEYRMFLWEDIERIKPYDRIKTVYMSAWGDDGSSGSYGEPVATLSRAVEAATTLSEKTSADIIINIEDGEYNFSEPTVIKPNNNHKNGGKIIIRGHENTVFNGGEKVSGWTQYKGCIYKAVLNTADVRQLYINGRRAVRARSDILTGNGIFSDGDDEYENDGIRFNGTLPAGIADAKNAEIVWDLDWVRQRVPIDKITQNGIGYDFSMRQPYYYRLLSKEYKGTTPATGYESFYIENAFCLLDEPGEFYFDRDTKTIYYYLRNGESAEALSDCYAGVSEGFISFVGYGEDDTVKNFSIENVKFMYGTWLAPNTEGAIFVQGDKLVEKEYSDTELEGECVHSQINLTWAENIGIKNNTIAHIGSAAIAMSEGVKNCSAENNLISDTSAGAVIIGNWNHIYTDEISGICSGITVRNNFIENIAYEYASNPAVSLYCARSASVIGNTIENTANNGISVGWGWTNKQNLNGDNIIAGNRIINVMNVLSDGANIYVLGNAGGLKIIGNYLVRSNDTGDKTYSGLGARGGIYIDQGGSEIEISENAIEECSNWLFARRRIDIKNVNVHNNYSDTAQYVADFSDGAVTMNNNTVYNISERPAEVMDIIDNVGSDL